jgi:hypothetical protein
MRRSSTSSCHHRRAADGFCLFARLLATAAFTALVAAGAAAHAQTTFSVTAGGFVNDSGGVSADVVTVSGTSPGGARSTLVTPYVSTAELDIFNLGLVQTGTAGWPSTVTSLDVASGGSLQADTLSAYDLSITGSASSVVVSDSATVYSTLTLSGGGSLAVAGGLAFGGSGLSEIKVSQGSSLVTGALDSIQGSIEVADGGAVTLGGAATLGGGSGPALRISSTTGSPAVFTANAPVSFAGGATSLALGAGGLLVVNADVAAGLIGGVSGNSAVTINSGTFALGTAGGAAGFSTLSFGTANPLTLAGGRLEVGGLIFSGSGALVRSGGAISSGSLSVANGAVTLAAGDFVGGSPDGYGGGDAVTVGSGGVLTVQGSIYASDSMSPGNVTVANGGRLVLDGGSIAAEMLFGNGLGGYGTLSVSGSNGIAVTNGGTYSVDNLVLDDGASLPAGTVTRSISLANGATITSTSAFALNAPDSSGGPRLLDISMTTDAGIVAPRFAISGTGIDGSVSVSGRLVATTVGAGFGSGQLELSVTNGGTVSLGGGQTLQSLTLSSTTAQRSVVRIDGAVTLANGASPLVAGSGGLLELNANLDGSAVTGVTGSSAVTINSGTFSLGYDGAAGTNQLAFGTANPLTLAGGRLEVGSVVFNGSSSLARSGGILSVGNLSVTSGSITLAAGDTVGGYSYYAGSDVVTVGSGGVLTVQGAIDASGYSMASMVTVANGGRLILDGGSITAVNTSGAGGYGTLSVSGSNGIAVTNGGTYDVDDLVLDQGASLAAGTARRLISLDNGATITSTSAFSLQKPGSLELLSISTGTGVGTGIIAPRFSITGPASGTVMIGDRYVSTASDSSGSLALTVSGGTLALGGGGQTISSLNGSGVLEINGDVTSNSLSTFGGTLVVNANVDATSATAGGNTAVTLNSGTLSLPVNTGASSPFAFSTASPLTLNGGRIAGGALAFSGSAALVRTGGTLAVGALSVSSGSMTLAAGDTVGGGIYYANSDVVTVGSGGVLTVQGSINTGSGDLLSVGSVTVAAGGRLILAGGNISALSNDFMGLPGQGTLALSGSNAFSRTGGNYAVDALTLANASATYVGGDTIREAISVGDGSLLTTTTVLEILGRNPGSNLNIPASVSIASGGELRLTDFSGSVTVGMYANFPEVSSGTSIRYALGVAGNLASDLEAMLADGRITYTNAGGTVGVYYEPSLSPGYQGTTYVGYVTAVPEPSTLALAGLGIACAWRVTRQSRRRPDGRVPAHDSPR